MTKILILVLSADFPPYDTMLRNSQLTWDSLTLEGVETVYYCANSGSPKITSHDVIYCPVQENYHTMYEKMLHAFKWALESKEFDYVARVHSSIYVDKNRLIEYVDNLPKENLFMGVKANDTLIWGGVGYLLSRDVVQKLVDQWYKQPDDKMEDETLSAAINDLGIPVTPLYAGAIDKMPDGWRCISYNGESISFTDFAELNRLKHHYYRIKVDGNREQDGVIMNKLFKALAK